MRMSSLPPSKPRFRGLTRKSVVILTLVVALAAVAGLAAATENFIPVGVTSPGRTVMVSVPQLTSTRYATVSNQTSFTYGNLTTVGFHVADLQVNPLNCTAYKFLVTVTGGNPPYGYIWSFGDLESSTVNSTTAVHNYSGPGNYTLTLFVHDTPITPLGPEYEQWKSIVVVVPSTKC
jgi:PKD domain